MAADDDMKAVEEVVQLLENEPSNRFNKFIHQ